MTKDDAIRGAVDKIETVTRWIKGGCGAPTLVLCVSILEMATRDLNALLDQKGQDDDK